MSVVTLSTLSNLHLLSPVCHGRLCNEVRYVSVATLSTLDRAACAWRWRLVPYKDSRRLAALKVRRAAGPAGVGTQPGGWEDVLHSMRCLAGEGGWVGMEGRPRVVPSCIGLGFAERHVDCWASLCCLLMHLQASTSAALDLIQGHLPALVE